MRITTGTLMKNAKSVVAQRVQLDRRLVCAYLTGSLAIEDDPLIGGTTDIDLVFIEDSDPPVEREIVRLTEEIHVDISHYSLRNFQDTRHLRQIPWLGSYLCLDPIVLHDVQHRFDFIQAGSCSQFTLPENVLMRCRPFIEDARQRWMALSQEPALTPTSLYSYLKALEEAANAIAVIGGGPLTERRFFQYFPQRAADLQRPGLASGLVDLFFDPAAADWEGWIPQWVEAFRAAGKTEGCHTRLHPTRLAYYERAVDALRSSQPAGAAWILLRTWCLAAIALPVEHPAQEAFRSACEKLSLNGENFQSRLDSLDAYLDVVESTLDQWATDNTITPLSERV